MFMNNWGDCFRMADYSRTTIFNAVMFLDSISSFPEQQRSHGIAYSVFVACLTSKRVLKRATNPSRLAQLTEASASPFGRIPSWWYNHKGTPHDVANHKVHRKPGLSIYFETTQVGTFKLDVNVSKRSKYVHTKIRATFKI